MSKTILVLIVCSVVSCKSRNPATAAASEATQNPDVSHILKQSKKRTKPIKTMRDHDSNAVLTKQKALSVHSHAHVKMIDRHVCINDENCQCPQITSVGNRCGGGVVIKAADHSPDSNYTLVSMIVRNQTDRSASWQDAQKNCQKTVRHGYADWKLPMCGTYADWYAGQRTSVHRDPEYCELQILFTAAQNLESKFFDSINLSSNYWSSSPAPTNSGNSQHWVVSPTDLFNDQSADYNLHPYHCVRHELLRP